MNITIIGAGSFGKALAHILKEQKPRLADIEKDGTYSGQTQANIHEANIILLAVPSHALRNCLKMIKPLLNDRAKIISCTKGMHYKNDLLLPTQQIKRELNRNAAVLMGPNLSEEIINNVPTFAVIAGPKWAEDVIKHFQTRSFTAIPDTDIIGVEYGGAAKNVIAVTAGLLEGKYGKNSCNLTGAITALLIEDIKRIHKRYTGKQMPELAFTADLITSCLSSRNKDFGKRFGRKLKKEAITDLVKELGTVEGCDTLKALYEYSDDKHVDAPIIKALYKIFYRNANITTLTERIKHDHT